MERSTLWQGNKEERRTVRVRYCVLKFFVGVECEDEIVRAYRGAKEDVAIEYGV